MGTTFIDSDISGGDSIILPIAMSAQGSYELNNAWQGKDRSQYGVDLQEVGSPVYDYEGVTLNGVDQYLIQSYNSYSLRAISFWMYLDLGSWTQTHIANFGPNYTVSVASGVLTMSPEMGLTVSVIDGVQSNLLTANAVNHIVIDLADPVSIDKTVIGFIDPDKFGTGKYWKFRVYSRILTLADIEYLYDTEQ